MLWDFKTMKIQKIFFLLFLSLYTAEINIFEIIFSPCVRSPVSALDHFSHNWSHTSYTFPVPAQMFHNHSVLDFCSCKYGLNLDSLSFVESVKHLVSGQCDIELSWGLSVGKHERFVLSQMWDSGGWMCWPSSQGRPSWRTCPRIWQITLRTK